MRLRKLSKSWVVVAAVVALIASALVVEYLYRCHGNPLSRGEALDRATAALQRNVVTNPPMPLVEELFDSERKEWMFTFRNATCIVSVLADRCKGTDIGGISEGCKTH